MDKRDWINFGIALFIFALIQLVLGYFSFAAFIVNAIIALAVIHLVRVFRK